jgi:hypothetical protein
MHTYTTIYFLSSRATLYAHYLLSFLSGATGFAALSVHYASLFLLT